MRVKEYYQSDSSACASIARTFAARTRVQNCFTYQQQRHLRAATRGAFTARRRYKTLAAPLTEHAEPCVTPADQQRSTTRSITSPATATTPATCGPSRLVPRFSTIPSVSSSVLKSREHVHGKSDLASGEEVSLSDAPTTPRTSSRVYDSRDTAPGERDLTQDISAVAQDSLKHIRHADSPALARIPATHREDSNSPKSILGTRRHAQRHAQ
ncbi:hypothetical protein EDB83DRAFT_2599178 [Lactarius deliciosus]|nr:hypothetical protein EDB83DRAFT_2599178 [Lactarius deliciosus]